MRAAHRDAVIERGTTWRLAFQLWNPSGTTQAASALVPGDHVVVEGYVQTVYSVTPVGGSVELRFGQGLWSDPALTMKATALVQMAEQDVPIACLAAYQYDYAVIYDDDGVPVGGGPLVVQITSTIAEDGTVNLVITDAETWLLPSGTGQWDVTLQQSNGDFVRVLEGQFHAIPTVSGAPIADGYGIGTYSSGPYGDPLTVRNTR